jgi:hypothetical protein
MRWLTLLVLALMVACAPEPGAEPTATVPAATTSSSSASSTTAVVATTEPVAGCPQDAVFVDRGRVARVDQPTSDTNRLGLISWQVVEGCERFVIDLETNEGAPATTPPTVVVEFLESRQVLRLWIDVDSTVVTDQLVETSLVDRLYVVRALDGAMFVDFHLTGPAQARAVISSSPARLSLEMQAGLDPFLTPAVISDRIVVISPASAAETASTVAVSGYARAFEANVRVIATQSGQVVADAVATAADWQDTWGEFRTTVVLPPGEISMLVGEEGAGEGQIIGPTISLTVR